MCILCAGKMKIRRATRNDIPRISEIYTFVYRYNFRDILQKDYLYGKISYDFAIDFFDKSFKDMENNCGIEYYVLEDDNIIKGSVSLGFPENNEELVIIDLLIDVPFQHNNFGTFIMDYCIESAKNRKIKTLTLKVFEQNIVAINFYKKYDFKMEKIVYNEDWKINLLEYKKKI